MDFTTSSCQGEKGQVILSYNSGMDEGELLQFLAVHGITYRRFEHAPVYTCEQASQTLGEAPGTGTKNLLLWDKRSGRPFFVMAAEDKRLDLKRLGQILRAGELRLAPPEMLLEILGITPGAVTILALVNDAGRSLPVVVDRVLWQAQALHCHPLVNTATLVIPHDDLERFLALTGHSVQVLDLPGKPGAGP